MRGDRSGSGADTFENVLQLLLLSIAQVFLRNAEGEVVDREAAASAATIETLLPERADGSSRRIIQTIHRNEHGTFFQACGERGSFVKERQCPLSRPICDMQQAAA